MLCEHRCGVDRRHQLGRCHAPATARIFRHRVEYGEESFLNPCHLFYLSGCDLRCVYCINELNAFDPSRGHDLTPAFFQNALLSGRERGAKTLQWVGGEPTIHLPAILHAMEAVDTLPPIVWKSDFHFTPEALALLDGVVDVFVADFKFGNNTCAERLCGIPNYLEIITRNLLLAQNQARLVVRHLLLPGHEDCCWRPITQWLRSHMPDVELSIRGGYLPRCARLQFSGTLPTPSRQAFPNAISIARTLELRVVQ